MKFRYASIALSILFFFSNLYTQDFQTLYRNAVILLDWDTETFETKPDGFGSVMTNLVSALIDQSSIIIVSSTTWKNFFMRRTIYNDVKQAFQKGGSNWKKNLKYEESEGFTTYAKEVRYFENLESPHPRFSPASRISNFFICSLIDLSAWNVKNINDHFYCLIPKQYVQKLKESSPKVNMSEDEVLGIRASSLSEVSADEAMRSIQLADDMSKEFNNAVRTLFIPSKDTEFQYEWFFYLLGHGSQAGVGFQQKTNIAALSEDEFKQFLQFCNSAIKTRFLFYESCFVGGKNLVVPFKQKETDLPLIYNFYIASGTMIASKTYSLSLPVITFPVNKDELRDKIRPDFTMYFDLLTDYFLGKSHTSLSDIVNVVHDVKAYYKGVQYQVPVVRFPYTEWFQLADITNKVERLTKTKIDTINFEKKPLTIKDKDIVIIDVERPWGEKYSKVYRGIVAPITLACTQSSIPPKFIINSLADETVYYFEEIDARNCYPAVVFHSLLPAGDSQLVRIIIGKLLVKNNFPQHLFNDRFLYQNFQNYEEKYRVFHDVYIQAGGGLGFSTINFDGYYIFRSTSRGGKLVIEKSERGYGDFSTEKGRVELYIGEQTKRLQELSKVFKTPEQLKRLQQLSKVFETSAQKQQDIANALGQFANDLRDLEWVVSAL